MAKLIDLVGKRFGMLEVLEKAEPDEAGRPLWLCRCDCGSLSKKKGNCLRRGETTSCGCNKRSGIEHWNKYSHESSPFSKKPELESVYSNMLRRCYEHTNNGYKNYGGRGIQVCERWRQSYDNFYDDMIKGYQKGLTIERIDVNGNYTPENCTWVTKTEQCRNTRRTKLSEETVLMIRNSTMSTKDLMIEFNCSRSCIKYARSGKSWKIGE